MGKEKKIVVGYRLSEHLATEIDRLVAAYPRLNKVMLVEIALEHLFEAERRGELEAIIGRHFMRASE